MVVFANGDGTERAIFHHGGYSGDDRNFKGSNAGRVNNYIIRAGTDFAATKDLSGCTELNIQFYFTDTDAYNYWLPHMYIFVKSVNATETKWAHYPLPADINEITVDLSLIESYGIDLSSINWIGIKTFPATSTWWGNG